MGLVISLLFCGLFNDTVTLSTATFNILKLYILPTVYLYVCTYLRTNPEIFPYEAFSDWLS
jgi:hypothetical protein